MADMAKQQKDNNKCFIFNFIISIPEDFSIQSSNAFVISLLIFIL